MLIISTDFREGLWVKALAATLLVPLAVWGWVKTFAAILLAPFAVRGFATNAVFNFLELTDR